MRFGALLVVVPILAGALEPRVAEGQAVQNLVLRNSFNPIGAGARGLGMGGAFIGVADDGTAASFNPAGLAMLRRTELAAVGFHSHLETTSPNPDTGVMETEEGRHRAPDFFGVALPFEVGGRNLTVQFSYQRSVDLFGRGRAFTRDVVSLRDLGLRVAGSGRISADVFPEQSGAFRTASFSAGYNFTSRLSAGASVNYWFADWTSRGSVSYRISTVASPSMPALLLSSTTRQFDQVQQLRGLNLNLGILLRYPRLSIGGVLRMPFVGRYDLDETGTVATVEAGRPVGTPVPVAATMNSRLHWPRTAGVGLAVRPAAGLTVAADYSHSAWAGTYIEDVPDGALLTRQEQAAEGETPLVTYRNRNFFDLLDASQTSTSDTSEWRVGAEYLVSLPKVVLPIRAGLFRSESPVRDLARNDSRRIDGFTFGSGLNFSVLVLDVAFEQRESEGTLGLQIRRGATTSGGAVETVKERRIVASVIYRFADDDILKRVFRSLFVGPEDAGD